MALCPQIRAPPVAPPLAPSVASRRQRGARRQRQGITLYTATIQRAEGRKEAGWMQAVCVRAIWRRRRMKEEVKEVGGGPVGGR